jgi:hypothetical protein
MVVCPWWVLCVLSRGPCAELRLRPKESYRLRSVAVRDLGVSMLRRY